ncbi:hypothetical protein FN846DRAFT_909653 [Sphaerosporella brunnea]|uniref:Uncharacterized protein n=1 Tax=Sphaerosporella brunnea TaxID=1250544 RepID=A0A5J5EQ24_9PEZI|nr:hypothetical protein FN846DRAFT_909653 [Sphaerosporella brunnea]
MGLSAGETWYTPVQDQPEDNVGDNVRDPLSWSSSRLRTSQIDLKRWKGAFEDSEFDDADCRCLLHILRSIVIQRLIAIVTAEDKANGQAVRHITSLTLKYPAAMKHSSEHRSDELGQAFRHHKNIVDAYNRAFGERAGDPHDIHQWYEGLDFIDLVKMAYVTKKRNEVPYGTIDCCKTPGDEPG